MHTSTGGYSRVSSVWCASQKCWRKNTIAFVGVQKSIHFCIIWRPPIRDEFVRNKYHFGFGSFNDGRKSSAASGLSLNRKGWLECVASARSHTHTRDELTSMNLRFLIVVDSMGKFQCVEYFSLAFYQQHMFRFPTIRNFFSCRIFFIFCLQLAFLCNRRLFIVPFPVQTCVFHVESHPLQPTLNFTFLQFSFVFFRELCVFDYAAFSVIADGSCVCLCVYGGGRGESQLHCIRLQSTLKVFISVFANFVTTTKMA